MKQPTLAVDFDGVVRAADGEPVDGCKDSLMVLRPRYRLVLYTCRHADYFMPWLRNHSMLHLFEAFYGAGSSKPRADVYLDDRAVRFVDWDAARKELCS